MAWPGVDGNADRGLLLLPPLLEEANLARSFQARIARGAAHAGHTALVFDLSCTGDSSGAFAHASWADWQADVEFVFSWMADRVPRVDILAIGSAALHLPVLLDTRDLSSARICLVQPMLNGDAVVTDWLRIRVAGALIAGHRETQAELRQRLRAGEAVELGGYELSPGVYQGLVDTRLSFQDLAAVRSSRVVDAPTNDNGGQAATSAIERVDLSARWSWPLEQPEPPQALTRAVTEYLYR